MNTTKAPTIALISTAMLALSAGAAWAGAGETPSPRQSQVRPSRAQAAQIAAQSLRLQPGDEQRIAGAVSNPVVFTATPKEREFTGELIVHARQGKAPRATARVATLTLQSSAFVPEQVIRVPAGVSEGEMAAVLMATGDYEFVEPNWKLYPAAVPNDPQYSSSWQHTRIDSAAAWDLNTGSNDVIVAVCDSGVDLDHPDLQASLIPGYNAPSNRTQENGGDVDDINGHGTFVAGCAAARGNNSTGVTGVGWNFSIMPVRVSNNTDGTAGLFDILEGARWAAEHGAKVVNASFSGGTAASNQTTGRYLKTQGALLFWASGNDNAYVSPNRPDYVLVGSTTQSDRRSSFSNYGPAVDVTAPGSGVRSTQRGGGYGNSSGTSFASPIAAGVGAMIFSVNPDFSADDVQDILYHSVDDLGDPGRDDSFGRGRVNTHNAVVVAQSYVRPFADPISESFEDSAWQSLLTATAGSVETVAVADAPDGASVLLLDGDDSVETVRLAGRTLNNPVLGFDLKASSIEAGESLTIQYLQDSEVAPDTWTTLLTINGQGRTGVEFVHYDIVLPDAYQWHGVQLRFVADGDDASDAWEIDALAISELAGSVAPLADDFETNLISPTRWNTTDNAAPAYADNNFFASLSDGGLLTSRDVPLAQFGIVPSYIRFDAWVGGAVQSSDELTVEVYNIGDEWQQIATIYAADLTTSPQLQQFDVPIVAIAIDDMKLRLHSSTSGVFNIDDVYVGVEQLSVGCNMADLAEPYGVLNFFDISAFLNAFNSHDPAADFTGDGVYNFFDVSAMLSAFTAGCP